VLINDSIDLNALLNSYKPNEVVSIVFERWGVTKETTVTFQESSIYGLSLFEANGIEPDVTKKASRVAWLQAK
jgi:hypothetical protein